jgi:cell division protein FtsB
MGLIDEFRRRGRHVLGPALGVTAVVYFAYHAVNGERGLVAWHVLEQQVAETRAAADSARSVREQLELRTMLLHPQRVDQDMLDEWARRVLNYGLADETVILLPATAGPAAN